MHCPALDPYVQHLIRGRPTGPHRALAATVAVQGGTAAYGVATHAAAVGTFGAATWAGFETRWWLVAAAAVAGGFGYASKPSGGWHAYRHPGPPRGRRLTVGVRRTRRARVPGARRAAGRRLMADPLIHAPARAHPQGVRAGRRTTWIGLTSPGQKAVREHVAALRRLIDVVERSPVAQGDRSPRCVPEPSSASAGQEAHPCASRSPSRVD